MFLSGVGGLYFWPEKTCLGPDRPSEEAIAIAIAAAAANVILPLHPPLVQQGRFGRPNELVTLPSLIDYRLLHPGKAIVLPVMMI